MNDEYLNWVIEKYDIDYVVHGDDPCIVDGKDVSSSYQLTLGAGGYELTATAANQLSAAASTAPMTGLVAAIVAIIAFGLNK